MYKAASGITLAINCLTFVISMYAVLLGIIVPITVSFGIILIACGVLCGFLSLLFINDICWGMFYDDENNKNVT
jgi:hypothetical protein